MEKCCPVCGSQLTLKQAIEILNGSGCVQVKRADGLIDYLPANLVNPRAVEVLEELRLSPWLRQTVKTLFAVRCKFIVLHPGTVLGWTCR
jgi:hypothetical protein